jgi:hypothetical protein
MSSQIHFLEGFTDKGKKHSNANKEANICKNNLFLFIYAFAKPNFVFTLILNLNKIHFLLLQ